MDIQIKGIREGLLITLEEGAWPEVQTALLKHLDDQAEFLHSGNRKESPRLALDVGNQVLKAALLGDLRDEISERGLTLWAVISISATTEQTAQMLGLATRIHNPRFERPAQATETAVPGGMEVAADAVYVQRTLRSGFKLQHPGHVVVVGDVNPGAEIIAGGDVVVWGRLKGMVHAGALGDENAIVCALDLSPTQLRIADQISIPPQRRGKPHPEMARIQDGQVLAEPWEG